jgi:hypothetical protein
MSDLDVHAGVLDLRVVEHAPGFTLLESVLTFESRAITQEMTEKLLNDNPDIRGLYVAGGGITGAIAALHSTGRAGSLVVVGYELMDMTRAALLDGTLTFVISHPLARIAQEALAGMVAPGPPRAKAATSRRSCPSRSTPARISSRRRQGALAGIAILDGTFFDAAPGVALSKIAIQLRIQSSIAAVRACCDSARIG